MTWHGNAYNFVSSLEDALQKMLCLLSVNFDMPGSQRYNYMDMTACIASKDKKLTSVAPFTNMD